MAPAFPPPRSGSSVGNEADISAAGGSCNEGLLQMESSSANEGTPIHDAADDSPPTSQDAKPSVSFLPTDNHLPRSPRSAVTGSRSTLLLPPCRPRARSAPATPAKEARMILPIELPAHVPAKGLEEGSTLSNLRSDHEQDTKLWASSWFRRPQEVVTKDLPALPTMPDPTTAKTEKDDQISPKNRAEVRGRSNTSSGTSRSPGACGGNVRTGENQDHTLHPAMKGARERSSSSRSCIHMPSWPVAPAGLLGPLPPGAGAVLPPPPYAGFPGVSILATQLRTTSVPGPLGPTSQQFPAATSQPADMLANTQTAHAALGVKSPPRSPGSELAALRTSHATYVANLNEAHAQEMRTQQRAYEGARAHIQAQQRQVENQQQQLAAQTRQLNEQRQHLDAQNRSLESSRAQIATQQRDITNLSDQVSAQAHEISEQAKEIASLKTHIALLEKQAALRPGQHLSPSGLLPPLNTSPPLHCTPPPEDVMRNLDSVTRALTNPCGPSTSTHNRPPTPPDQSLMCERTTAQQAGSATDSHTTQLAPPTKPSPAPLSPFETSEYALEIENLRSALSRRGTECSTLSITIATLEDDITSLRRTISCLTKERDNWRDERDLLVQTVQLKERKEVQMKGAMTRAAERENSLKVKIQQIEGKLEASDAERVDLREAWEEVLGRVKAKERELGAMKVEWESLKEAIAIKKSEQHSAASREDGAVETELRNKLADVEKQLEREKKRVQVEKDQTKAAAIEAIELREKVKKLEKALAASPEEQMGMITIGNALIGDLSPIGPNSVLGRLHLLRGEVRNLNPDERSRLMEELRRLEGRGSYVDHHAQTAKVVVDEKSQKERDKAHKAIVRKLEAERDQLSGLLSTEIRRTARQSAKSNDGLQGLSRLERWDSMSNRMSVSIRGNACTISVNSAELGKSASFEDPFEHARQVYEEEIRGLVNEIILYKLDIKGYKKDLRKANEALKMLKSVSTPIVGKNNNNSSNSNNNNNNNNNNINDDMQDLQQPESAKVEALNIRPRASTINVVHEKVQRESEPEGSNRAKSVDGLGITYDCSGAREDGEGSSAADAQPDHRPASFARKDGPMDRRDEEKGVRAGVKA